MLVSSPTVDVAADPSPRPVRAILFDVDGTLYPQLPLRLYMLARLSCAAVANPWAGRRSFAFLRAYRRAQEHIRSTKDAFSSGQQLTLACEWSGEDTQFGRQCVHRWMETEPLPALKRLVRPGVESLLRRAQATKMKLGVVSDYPAHAKLEAMGLLDFFNVVVSAQEEGVKVFKPSPQGLLRALELLDVAPQEALYVGDRVEVDGEAAKRANIRAVIVGRPTNSAPEHVSYVTSFGDLERVLFGAKT